VTTRHRAPPPWAVGLVISLVLLAVASVVLLLFLPGEAVPSGKLTASDKIRLDAESNVRTTILQYFGGVALLVGLVFTARTVHLTRETHLTDRFTKAVDQLGNGKVEVRVGGIYALQRLARNSSVDQPAVTDLLRAYLAINAPRRAQTRSLAPQTRLRDDIQAALTGPHRGVLFSPVVDLSSLDLRGARLVGAQLSRASLDQSLLTHANLSQSNLDHASLNNAVLDQADLSDANLAYASLQQASISNATLVRAVLDHADLRQANLTGTRAPGASLYDVYLTEAVLEGAQLQAARLEAAYLDYCDLSKADLTDASLNLNPPNSFVG
jgi:uncharacterized protein YjbI with pentapeptide repeats